MKFTKAEFEYYIHGGMFRYIVRQMLKDDLRTDHLYLHWKHDGYKSKKEKRNIGMKSIASGPAFLETSGMFFDYGPNSNIQATLKNELDTNKSHLVHKTKYSDIEVDLYDKITLPDKRKGIVEEKIKMNADIQK